MQHLLLAVAIIMLTIIAGNGVGKTAVENNKGSVKIEKPVIDKEESDFPEDKPSIVFTRFDMFVY
jgi:hypothetical protein